MRDKGRHIKGPHPDDRHMILIGREFQAAVGLVKKIIRRLQCRPSPKAVELRREFVPWGLQRSAVRP